MTFDESIATVRRKDAKPITCSKKEQHMCIYKYICIHIKKEIQINKYTYT